ncbi:MAG: CDP-alcohol phosphatidyltransferase family protein, partial [Gemmatimonadota bacterium]|nr:CDP-alcohol phosphatidyltransferase family protein [Gemmatimonadota bacterium]
MKLLGSLEKPFYATVNPLVQRLIRAGVRPNTITTIGTGLVLVSAIVYATGHIRLGGLLLLLSGVADTLDGQVARGGAMVTRFGAFYDSTLDRVGDG